MGPVKWLNATTSSRMIDLPEFHLVAELLGDGTLVCHPNLQKLLSKSECLEIVIVSTVEDQILGKPRMIDHVQYSLFSEQKKFENWYNRDIWKAWQKSPQKHFPCYGSGSVPAELQGKNGILLKTKPYIGSSSGLSNCGLPVNIAVFFMSIWIGAPEYLDDPGFTKLADFLYFASSSVIQATFNPNQLQCSKRFLWYSSISNAYQEHAKVFKRICFLFFNWPYDEENADLKLFGHIKSLDFKRWTEISPTVKACCKVSQRFHSTTFYCFNALVQQGLDVKALKNVLGTYNFKIRKEWLTPKLNPGDKFDVFVRDIMNQLNQHYYSPVDPLLEPSVSPAAPKLYSTATLHLQNGKRPEVSATDDCQVQREHEISLAVKKYQHHFKKLFMENPTTDLAKQYDSHCIAAIEVCEGFLESTDINLAIETEWNKTTGCLTELNNKLADLEPAFSFFLMSHDVIHQKLVDFVEAASKDLQDFCLVHENSKQVLEHFVSTHGKPVLDKMLQIVETFTASEKTLVLASGYLQDKTIIDARQEAISKFQNANSALDSTAVFVLENKFKIIGIHNECLKRKAVILAGKAHQDALAEYRKSMDRLLEKAVYSRQSLIETHERVIDAVLQTFSSEDFQNEIWQDMSMKLKGEMQAQFPVAMERNYINSKAAYRRYEEVLSSAFTIYKTNLGLDYDHLKGMKKIETCEAARRAALAAYFEKVAGEPQDWVSQWYQDLSDRISRESLAQSRLGAQVVKVTPGDATVKLRLRATEADGTPLDEDVEMADLQTPVNPEESKLKRLLRSCIEEMEEKFSYAELSRPTKLSLRKALDAAKQVLELEDQSDSKLRQALDKLNVWRPSLNMPVLDF